MYLLHIGTLRRGRAASRFAADSARIPPLGFGVEGLGLRVEGGGVGLEG